jgi:large subunit ribosomal protein L30e
MAKKEEEKEEKASTAGTRKRVKSKKKVIRKRKTKKEKEKPLSSAVRLAVESGKVEFGSRSAIRALLTGESKAVIIAKNAPKILKEDTRKYGHLSNIPVIDFDGSSRELGSVCGKPFPVLMLAVYEEGVSPILSFTEKKTAKKK